MTASTNLEPNPITQSVQRCLDAYHHILEQPPRRPRADEYAENVRLEIQRNAAQAFCRAMPFLDTWEHTLAVLACLQHAMLLGILDRVDLGRHIHLLQLAISAFRPPKPEPRAVGRPRKITPLPSIGNLGNDIMGTYIAPDLPDEETQRELCEELKRRNIPLPTPEETAAHPRLLPLFFAMANAYLNQPVRKGPQSAPKTGVATPSVAAPPFQAAG